MVTISHLVQKYVDNHPFIEEGLRQGIISHAGLAESMHKGIETELKKKVKVPAIVMAIRRHSENLEVLQEKMPKKISSELTLRTNISVVHVDKNIAKKLYHELNHKNIIGLSYGLEDACIICKKKDAEGIKGKKISGLVCITITFSEKYVTTQGVLFAITRELAWNNVNIVELLSAGKELSVIISEKDSEKAFESLRKILD